MPNIKSAIKRAKQEQKSYLINRQNTSKIRTFRRKFRESINSDDIDNAKKFAHILQSILDSSATHGYIPKNRASRLVSNTNTKLKGLFLSLNDRDNNA